jgi:DnaJ domain
MAEALKLAIDLLHVPSRVRTARGEPLPQDLLSVLLVAAGDEAAIAAATEVLGRPRSVVEDAVSFFIEQILFCPQSDSYRVLGAAPDATNMELRRNMAMLLRWVHPDLDRRQARASFATRVSRAWDDLKTPERRAAYDAGRQATPTKAGRPRRIKPLRRTSRLNGHMAMREQDPGTGAWPPPRGFLRRTLSFLFRRS